MERSFDKQKLLVGGSLALVCVAMAAYGGMLSLSIREGMLGERWIQSTLGWYGLAMVAYLGLVWWQERHAGWNPWLVWGGALLFHVLLIFTSPTLSTDVYRYLWDGHVANHGVSPYAYAIDASELDTLATSIRERANHAWMASPYLPTAQWLFGLVTWSLPLAPWSMQIVMSSLSFGNGLLILHLLRRAGIPARRVVVYLWNPLVVIEAAHGAHVDVWMVILLLAAITLGWQASRRPESIGAILLSMAILTKVIPILAVPVLGRRWRLTSWALLCSVSVCAMAWAAFWAGLGLTGPLDGTGLFGALRIYGDQWDFNSGIYRWLHIYLARVTENEGADWLAKSITVTSLAGVVVWTWWQAGTSASLREDLRLMSIPLMGYILLTTTVHPWYFIPVVAFLPFWTPGPDEPRRQWLFTVPWLYLSVALMLSYLTYLDPANMRELAWVRQIEWLPTLGGLALVWLSRILPRRLT